MGRLAREVWGDADRAGILEQEAERLRESFDRDFWLPERGHYALALDRAKRPLDSLTSNIGQLMWTGIVTDEHAEQTAQSLLSDELFTGWGVRTMGTVDAGYSPLSYHNGTVWPHDNSLIAWGLARYARWPEAQRIVRTMLDAASHFGYQLPEVFAGLPRTETSFPIAYPTAARPQAWAAGTPVLLLQLLLGLQPDPRRQALETVAPLELPSWTGTIRVSGVRAFDRTWDVRLEDGSVRVEGV
jgi:glycogen debranching enzyme